MRSEVADVTGNVNYICKSVQHQSVGRGVYGAPCCAAYDVAIHNGERLLGRSLKQLIITVSFVCPHAQCPIGKATLKVFRYIYLPSPVTSSPSLKLFLGVKIKQTPQNQGRSVEYFQQLSGYDVMKLRNHGP